MPSIVLDWATSVATADVISEKFWPVTGWIRAADVARLKAVWEQVFSATTTSAQWVRFGFTGWYNAGGTPPLFGRIGGVVEYGEAG